MTTEPRYDQKRRCKTFDDGSSIGEVQTLQLKLYSGFKYHTSKIKFPSLRYFFVIKAKLSDRISALQLLLYGLYKPSI